MISIRLQPIRMPGGLFDPAAFRRVVRNVRAARAADIEVDFNTTTATWSNAPKANVEFIGDGEAKIFMVDDRYTWVNDGTRAHVIRPRNASRLVFQANYRAKTIGGFIGSRAGGPFGPTVYSRGVMHPGTTGRFFDIAIADKWNRLLPAILERAILAEL